MKRQCESGTFCKLTSNRPYRCEDYYRNKYSEKFEEYPRSVNDYCRVYLDSDLYEVDNGIDQVFNGDHTPTSPRQPNTTDFESYNAALKETCLGITDQWGKKRCEYLEPADLDVLSDQPHDSNPDHDSEHVCGRKRKKSDFNGLLEASSSDICNYLDYAVLPKFNSPGATSGVNRYGVCQIKQDYRNSAHNNIINRRHLFEDDLLTAQTMKTVISSRKSQFQRDKGIGPELVEVETDIYGIDNRNLQTTMDVHDPYFPSEWSSISDKLADMSEYEFWNINGYYYPDESGCDRRNGCVPGAHSAMYLDKSVNERLCANCERCDEVIKETQAILPTYKNYDRTSTDADYIKDAMKTWKSSFSCCSCSIIKGGKRCLPTRTLPARFYKSSCAAYAMLPSFTHWDGTEVEMRAGNIWKDSFACTGKQVTNVDETCYGLFYEPDGEFVTIDGGITCVREHQPTESYTKTAPLSCKDRFINQPQEWFVQTQEMQACYNFTDWPSKSCQSFEEMDESLFNTGDIEIYHNEDVYQNCRDSVDPNTKQMTYTPRKHYDCCMQYDSNDCSRYTGTGSNAWDRPYSSQYSEYVNEGGGYNKVVFNWEMCDRQCNCAYDWNTYNCTDNVQKFFEMSLNPIDYSYGSKNNGQSQEVILPIIDTTEYCRNYMNQSCCESFKDSPDYSSGSLPNLNVVAEQSLCQWYPQIYTYFDVNLQKDVEVDYGYCAELPGLKHMVGSSTAKCMVPITDTANKGTLDVLAAASGYDPTECVCIKGEENFNNPTFIYKPTSGGSAGVPGDDDKCPHKGKCYLDMGVTCPQYTYTGLWTEEMDQRDYVNSYSKVYPQRFKYGATYCMNSDTDPDEYVMSGIDLISTGCGGFTATFGCDTGNDQIAIGDLLKTDSAMFTYATGTDMWQECRDFNLFNAFHKGGNDNDFPIGDYSDSNNQVSDMMQDAQTRIFLALFFIAIFKEILGLVITVMTYINHGYAVDLDVDYVSVGKDSFAGLLMLLYVLTHLQSGEVGLYAERYKQLMDGYTPERIAELKERNSLKLEKKAKLKYERAMKKREALIKRGKDPATLEMPQVEFSKGLDIAHKNKDGTYHVSDIHDIEPLIEPYTIFYHFWHVFEFVESVAGLAFGLLYFFRLAVISDAAEVPSFANTVSAGIAVGSSGLDLFLNILGHLWHPLGWPKYIKRFMQFFCIMTFLVFCGLIQDTIYEQQPGCRKYIG